MKKTFKHALKRIVNSKFFTLFLVAGFLMSCTSDEPGTPTIYLVGDSTVKNGSGLGSDGLWGWGNYLPDEFDTTRIHIENHAIGGRSSRTFLTEGRWDTIMKYIQPGDYVLIQLGHNDGGPYNTGRARASLKGTGNETVDVIMERDSSLETVHTFGWYIRNYVKDAKDAGAVPIVLSPVPRNIWIGDSVVIRADFDYGLWAEQVAMEEGAFFIDLNDIIARRYEGLGIDSVAAFFPIDHTHTNLEGAILNANAVAEGISKTTGCDLSSYLRSE